jgi:ADP-ribosyl-[dinitrogen reductase] hydrolase
MKRFLGCLVDLAAGDALGPPLEFMSPGSFDPVTDMVDSGASGLRAGQWTDDTAMALYLAESLIEKNGFDSMEQLRRYVCRFRQGHLGSTGQCSGIGNTSGLVSPFRNNRCALLRGGRALCPPHIPIR